MQVIIVSPSLNPSNNVSGISSVTNFIIKNSKNSYIHFELGKKDFEKGGIRRIFAILKSFSLWIKLLSKYPNAIIHYNFPLSKASVFRDPLFIFFAIAKKRKLVIHIHGGIFLTSDRLPLLVNFILKKIFSLKVPFIVLSDSEVNKIKNKFDCKNIFILPNCVDLNIANEFIRKKNINKCLCLGYLGRIAKTKGMEYLLHACIELKKMNIPFTLRIAGKEEFKDEFLPFFKEKLGESFYYDGVIAGESKDDFLKNIDIFILPSFFEGLPMSLIEAMSFGVVPITTNVGSIGEIIKDENNGLFIGVKDYKSIVNRIIDLNNNRDLLYKLSLNAKKIITDKFSPEEYIKKLNYIYSLT